MVDVRDNCDVAEILNHGMHQGLRLKKPTIIPDAAPYGLLNYLARTASLQTKPGEPYL